MKETLIYFLTFVHPKTHEVIFHPKGRNCIQYRTRHLPRVGDHIELDFEIVSRGKYGRKHARTHRLQFAVVEVHRLIIARDPEFEIGHPAYFEECTSFSVRVTPTTEGFTATIRLLRQFYEETSLKWREWRSQ